MLLKKLEYHQNCDTNDDRLFIDYNLIQSCEGFDSEAGLDTIQDYMEFNLELYRKGYKKEVSNNFKNFSERNYFPSVGFAHKSSGGRAASNKKFLEILELIFNRDCAEKLLVGNIFSPVFVKDYNKDRNSDFLITLMLPQISKYTEKVAEQNGLETERIVDKVWDSDTNEWIDDELVLAKLPDDIKFRLILPEKMLTPQLPYSASNFIFVYWRQILNNNEEKKGLDKYTYKRLKKYIKDNFGSNHEYLLYILSKMGDEELVNYLTGFEAQSKANRDNKDE